MSRHFGQEPTGYFDVEVLVRIPGQPKPNRVGWVRAPLNIRGGDFGRASIDVDLGPLMQKFQQAVHEVFA